MTDDTARDGTTPDDDVLAALRDLPPELPDVPDRLDRVRRLRDRHRRRRTAGLAGAAAAAVVLAVLATGAVRGGLPLRSSGPAAATSASTCPPEYGPGTPWVPGSPSVPDGGTRMVPTATPTAALLCRYPESAQGFLDGSAPPARLPLDGSKQLTGALDALAADLAWLPQDRLGADHACTLVGGPTTHYLLGLTYPDGVVWVAGPQDPNDCDQTWNGRFASLTNIGRQLAASYDRGSWAPGTTWWTESTTDNGPCWTPRAGRLGDGKAVVPPGGTTLRVCRGGPGSPAPWVFVDRPDAVAAVTEQLNRLDRGRSDFGCQMLDPDAVVDEYEILVGYPAGPPVRLWVNPNCRPGVLAGRWAIDDPAPVAALAKSLLGG